MDRIKEKEKKSEEDLGLKEVHINKSPVLAPAKTLTPDQAERWNLSGWLLRSNLASIKNLLVQDPLSSQFRYCQLHFQGAVLSLLRWWQV